MDDLQARLEAGVVAVGLADDNCTELFDIEGANELMHESASALAEAQADISRLREALQDVVNPLAHLERCAEGHPLSGQAYAIANDLWFVQSIARAALGDAS